MLPVSFIEANNLPTQKIFTHAKRFYPRRNFLPTPKNLPTPKDLGPTPPTLI